MNLQKLIERRGILYVRKTAPRHRKAVALPACVARRQKFYDAEHAYGQAAVLFAHTKSEASLLHAAAAQTNLGNVYARGTFVGCEPGRDISP